MLVHKNSPKKNVFGRFTKINTFFKIVACKREKKKVSGLFLGPIFKNKRWFVLEKSLQSFASGGFITKIKF